MMKKILLVLVTVITFAMNGKAQSNSDRLSLGVGCLYQNGLDLTLSYEHEGKCRLQALCSAWSQPLWQCPYRSIGRE